MWGRARQRPVEQELRYRRYGWLDHTLRRPRESITKQVLSWNPEGKRKKCRPINTWRCEMTYQEDREDLERSGENGIGQEG
jgi:hypothetical protein